MQPRSSNRNKQGRKGDGEKNYVNRDYKTAIYYTIKPKKFHSAVRELGSEPDPISNLQLPSLSNGPWRWALVSPERASLGYDWSLSGGTIRRRWHGRKLLLHSFFLRLLCLYIKCPKWLEKRGGGRTEHRMQLESNSIADWPEYKRRRGAIMIPLHWSNYSI